jgi:hypothetical protein
MWNTSPRKGKIPYVPLWKFDCKISPVITLDQEIIPGSCWKEFAPDIKNFDDFEITVSYDQQVLYQGKINSDDCVSISEHLLDDKENIDHKICITLHGKTDDHSCFYQGKSVSLGISIDLAIEDMPLGSTLLEAGLKNIMGENETQTLVVNTPIYQWLLQNQEYIMADLF